MLFRIKLKYKYINTGVKDSTIPKLFILFIIAFSTIVLIFAFISHITFTGLVTENAYQKGLDFNKINQVSLEFNSDIQAKISIVDNIIYLNLNKDLSSSADIQAKLIKPVSAQYDQVLYFTHIKGRNLTANLPFVEQGIWEIRIKICEQQKEYVFNHRFYIIGK